jgi:prevent-host-death family protein
VDTIGSYEAKTHLPHYLDRVALGETFLITRNGKPVGMLVPPSGGAPPTDLHRLARALITWRNREGPILGPDTTIRNLIDDGRR